MLNNQKPNNMHIQKRINKLNDLTKIQVRVTTIYEILGIYGDRLPKSVQEEMREKAEIIQAEIDKSYSKLLNQK